MKTSQIGYERKLTLRQLLFLLPLAAALALAGCNQKTGVTGDVNPAGTYALVSVDGHPVPGTVQHEGHALPVKSGSFDITADGHCTSRVYLSGRDVPIEVKATYTRDGARLTMKWEGAGTTIGTVEGDTFTMNNEGMVFVYRR